MKKNLIYNLFATGAFYFAQWYNIILLAKITSAESVGVYTLLFAISMPIFYFFSMGLRNVITSDNHAFDKINIYISNRVIGVILSFIIISIIVFVYPTDIDYVLILLFSLIKVFEFLSDLIYGFWQNKERFKIICFFQIAKTILIIFVTTPITYIYGNIESLLFTNLAIFSIAFLVELIIFYKTTNFRMRNVIHFTQGVKLYKTVIPLGFSFLLINMINNLPRFLLERYTSLYYLGIFSSIFFITMIASFFMTSLSQVAMPKLRDNYVKGENKKFIALIIKMGSIGIILAVLIITGSFLIGKDILYLLYGEEYAEYEFLMVQLSFGLLFTYATSFLNNSLIVLNRFKSQFVVQIFSFIILYVSLIVGLSFSEEENIGYFIVFSDFLRALLLVITFFICFKQATHRGITYDYE